MHVHEYVRRFPPSIHVACIALYGVVYDWACISLSSDIKSGIEACCCYYLSSGGARQTNSFQRAHDKRTDVQAMTWKAIGVVRDRATSTQCCVAIALLFSDRKVHLCNCYCVLLLLPMPIHICMLLLQTT